MVIPVLIVPICFSLDELGDMLLFPYQKQLLEGSRNGKNKRGAADANNVPIWPNGTVPYVMDPKIIGKWLSGVGIVVMWLLPTTTVLKTWTHCDLFSSQQVLFTKDHSKRQ